MYDTVEVESSFKSISYIEPAPGLALLVHYLFLEF